MGKKHSIVFYKNAVTFNININLLVLIIKIFFLLLINRIVKYVKLLRYTGGVDFYRYTSLFIYNSFILNNNRYLYKICNIYLFNTLLYNRPPVGNKITNK